MGASGKRLRHFREKLLTLIGLACLLWAAPVPTQAQPQLASPSPIHHTAWRTVDGAPGPVTALTQTTDGWLWIGTSTGLFRFDGVRFDRVETLGGSRLAHEAVASLASGASGELWIGYRYGGASRFRQGRLIHYTRAEGLPNSVPIGKLAAAHGDVWAASKAGLFKFNGSRWNAALPGHEDVSEVIIDRQKNVWFVSRARLMFLSDGAREARVVGEAVGDGDVVLHESPDGSVWSLDQNGRMRRFGPEGRRPAGAVVPQALAVAGAPGGEIAAPAAVIEDREGAIWVGTRDGLDRFRHNKLQRVPLPESSVPVALASAESGAVWVARKERPLLKLESAPREIPNVRGAAILQPGPDGGLWVGSATGSLWHLTGNEVRNVMGPPQLRSGSIQCLGVDGGNHVWISGPAGLFRLEEDRTWSSWQGRAGFPDEPPRVIHGDTSGQTWFGFLQGTVAVHDGSAAKVLSQADGLDVGVVTAIHSRNGHVWIGGESGVQLYHQGRFVSLVAEGDTRFHAVSGIVERGSGELWLHAAEGIFRIAADEVAHFVSHPRHQPRFERFDQHDGLSGSPSLALAGPTAVEGGDGRLWFSTTSGLFSLDPSHILRNPAAPPVEIRGLKAGDRQMAAAGPLRLPSDATQVEISYTALSLLIPERVQFRYRLEGVDASWRDAGARRAAFYTNLTPGHYRFQVMAANGDGVWSPQVAELRFSIEPMFYQTGAFRLACGILVAASFLMFLRWRQRRLTAKATERMRIRQIERDRIASELHDTLLQGFYALLLSVQAAINRISDPAVKDLLESAMERSERLVEAGRDRVAGLRRTSTPVGDIAKALRCAAEEMSHPRSAHITIFVDGLPQDLPADMGDEIYFIGSEAIANAVQHAQARRISVELEAVGNRLRLTVHDDGQGIPEEVLRRGGVEGHWGIRGMQERAARFGGKLNIVSDGIEGTTVELLALLPAS